MGKIANEHVLADRKAEDKLKQELREAVTSDVTYEDNLASITALLLRKIAELQIEIDELKSSKQLLQPNLPDVTYNNMK